MICPLCNSSVLIPTDRQGGVGKNNSLNGEKQEIYREIMAQLHAGKKIEAIKIYRHHFRVGLSEAKRAVEALESGRMVELPDPVPADSPQTFQSLPPMIPSQAGSYPKGKTASLRPIITWLIVSLVFLSIAAAIIPFLSDGKGVFFSIISPTSSSPQNQNSNRRPPILSDPVVLIPKSDAVPDIVLQTERLDVKPYTTTLSRLSSDTGKIVWESDPFGGNEPRLWQVIAAGDQVFAVVNTQLAAYNTADGKPLWTAKLSDKLYSCGGKRQCLAVDQNVIIAMTLDDMLEAFDTTTGHPLWQHRVYNFLDYSLFNHQVISFDRDNNKGENFIALLDLQTGKENSRFVPGLSFGQTSLTVGPSEIDIAEGGFFERWDVSSGKPKLAWHQESSTFWLQPNVIVGADAFYAGDQHGLAEIKLSDGSGKLLISSEDYQYEPLALEKDLLLVQAMKTRGSRTYQLWGINISTGEQTGPIDLAENAPAQDMYGTIPSDGFLWTWQLSGANLSIIEFSKKPNQVAIETVNLNTGGQGNLVTIPLPQVKSDFYSLRKMIGVQRHILWVMLDNQVFGIDLVKGNLAFASP